jgi:hypothetical protein
VPREAEASIGPASGAQDGDRGCALGIGQAARDACPADAAPAEATAKETTMTETNVLGGPLAPCCFAPKTGYYRDGLCRTGPTDTGRHVVCAQVTAEFLEFTRSRGNDLGSPAPDFDFPGLKPGDRWCLCVLRWREALEAGVAPPVLLESSHAGALRHVTREQLAAHALK